MRARALVAAAGLAALTSCSPGGAEGAGDADDGSVDVLAAFYPLQHVVEQVGGEHVSVTSLTATGARSHDLELTPAQVASVGEADLVVYLSDFQPATDAAVELSEPEHVVDAAGAAALQSDPAAVAPAGSEQPGEPPVLDPHFWLDPTRLADVAHQVAQELAAVDPDHAADHRARADRFASSLAELDAEYAAVLAPCRGATLVASHEAFGYLAQRYGLTQVGIAGIDPEVEPSPARLRDVAEVVEANGVRTLFFETLTGPELTRTLARDLGVATEVLDPIEGLTDESDDYPGLMRENLRALREGLVCTAP